MKRRTRRMLMNRRKKRGTKNTLTSSLKQNHGFVCKGNGENDCDPSCHCHGDDCGKCCPLLLNGCYFNRKQKRVTV